MSFTKAGCDLQEFQLKSAQKSPSDKGDVRGWGRNAEMCRVGLFISVQALCSHRRCYSPALWNQNFSPSLLQGWPCATREAPAGHEGSREQEQGLVPAGGGCWISHLRVQTDQDPSLLPPPSPPATPYTIPIVSRRWSKRYQLGSIYELSTANPVLLNFSFPLLKLCLLLFHYFSL